MDELQVDKSLKRSRLKEKFRLWYELSVYQRISLVLLFLLILSFPVGIMLVISPKIPITTPATSPVTPPYATNTPVPVMCNTCYNFSWRDNNVVDTGDIMVVAARWMKNSNDPEYDVFYDVSCPEGVPDGIINTGDIMVVAAQWMQTTDCIPFIVSGN